jgi:uncharacterized protein (TIGR02118 family)
MIVISVLYPKTADSHFDHSYYMGKHMPLVRSRWQAMGLTRDELLRGSSTLDGGQPGFELIGFLTFQSVAEVQKALAAFGQEIIADIPNFTNVSPLIQMNEVVS